MKLDANSMLEFIKAVVIKNRSLVLSVKFSANCAKTNLLVIPIAQTVTN